MPKGIPSVQFDAIASTINEDSAIFAVDSLEPLFSARVRPKRVVASPISNLGYFFEEVRHFDFPDDARRR